MPFYKFIGLGDVSNYVKFIQIHWMVSLKDALMAVLLYLIVGVLTRNMYWGRRFSNKRLSMLLVLGGLWAIIVEYHALNIAHRWAYADSMPLLPVLNVGLVPVLQMMIVPMIAILLIRGQLKS